jgi:polyhydroxybutyrate depolymerase
VIAMRSADRRTSRCLAGLLATSVLVVAGCGGSPPRNAARPSPSPTRIGYLKVGTVQRVYVEYRPKSAAVGKAIPLVVAMHGYTVDTTWMESTSHFDELADQNGFEVVYPQGMGDAWNAGRCCGHDGNDDVAFVRGLIDKLTSQGLVDRTRVFATGMSNGGLMAQRLACELADHITAVVSVSGSLVLDSCAPSRPISVMEMHGIEDDLVPYKGGTVAGLTYFPPTMSNMQNWAKLNGCGASPAVSQDGVTSIYKWSGCRAGTSVVLEAIAGAGHSWFSPQDLNGEPDATKVAWDFFQQSPPLA